MCDHSKISLGFTDQEFPPGIHVCQIISDNERRQESLFQFLLAGLKENERTSCFSDKIDHDVLSELLGNYGVSFDEVIASEMLTLTDPKPIYFQNNRFDPDRMINTLKSYYEESKSQGYSNARVIGEMSAEVQNIPGGDRLMEYESRVTQLIKTHPITAVCQYDSRKFDGTTILEILKVHPWMVIGDSVVHNPFHIQPEEYLETCTTDKKQTN